MAVDMMEHVIELVQRNLHYADILNDARYKTIPMNDLFHHACAVLESNDPVVTVQKKQESIKVLLGFMVAFHDPKAAFILGLGVLGSRLAFPSNGSAPNATSIKLDILGQQPPQFDRKLGLAFIQASAQAQYWDAVLYLAGRTVREGLKDRRPDYLPMYVGMINHYYGQAIDHENPKAMLAMAMLLRPDSAEGRTLGYEPDTERMFELLMRGSELGDLECTINYVNLSYAYGHELDRQLKHVMEERIDGLQYVQQLGKETEGQGAKIVQSATYLDASVKVMNQINQSAEQGDPQALSLLGTQYIDLYRHLCNTSATPETVSTEYLDKGIQNLKNAADFEDIGACLVLANIYTGTVVFANKHYEDRNMALKYLRMASDLAPNNPVILTDLASLLLNKFKDLKGYTECLEKAGKLGYPKAWKKLGDYQKRLMESTIARYEKESKIIDPFTLRQYKEKQKVYYERALEDSHHKPYTPAWIALADVTKELSDKPKDGLDEALHALVRYPVNEVKNEEGAHVFKKLSSLLWERGNKIMATLASHIAETMHSTLTTRFEEQNQNLSTSEKSCVKEYEKMTADYFLEVLKTRGIMTPYEEQSQKQQQNHAPGDGLQNDF